MAAESGSPVDLSISGRSAPGGRTRIWRRIRFSKRSDRGCGAPGERFWTLDPIDGTKGFVRGDQYVVALALVLHGRVELGLMGCPQLSLMERPRELSGSIVYAIRGRGAFCASMAEAEVTRLAVSHVREPRLARVLRSFEAEHIDQTTFHRLLRTLKVEAAPTLMDSQAKHAMVAAGRADLLIGDFLRPGTTARRSGIKRLAPSSSKRPAGG